MTKIISIALAASLLIVLATLLVSFEANAQSSICGKRDEIVARLESGYQEFSAAMGMATNGHLVELYTSDTGTWTLMLTSPEGRSCLIAAGENWQSMSPAKPQGPAA